MKSLNKKQQAKLQVLQGTLLDTIEKFNDARMELEGFREEVASEIEAYRDDRSDAWLESDRGQASEAWLDLWQTETEVEEIDAPDEEATLPIEQEDS